MAITKQMIITDVLELDENIPTILMGMGMHCIGCMAAAGESLEEAMLVHGYSPEDVDLVVSSLNRYLEKKEQAE